MRHTMRILAFLGLFITTIVAQESRPPTISTIPQELWAKNKDKLAGKFANWQQKVLRKTHGRLFRLFFPANELSLTEQQQQAVAEVDKKIWEYVYGNKNAQAGLWFLTYVPGLRFEKTTNGSYLRMIRSPVPAISKLAKEFRMLYLWFIYSSPLGKSISSYTEYAPPVTAPDIDTITADFRQKVAVRFNRKSLRYDSDNREVLHKDGTFDYIIVGSGAAGSVLAHQLRRGGSKVIVIERGSFAIPGAIDPTRIGVFQEMESRRTTVDGGIITRNANAVGGGPTVNIDLAFAPTLPTVRAKIEGWRKSKRIQQEQFSEEQIEQAYQWVTNAIGTRQLDESEINANNMILWEGSKKMGWPARLYDLNRHRRGASPHLVSDKKSAVDGLLLNALVDQENPLYLLSNAEVQRVLYEQVEKRRSAYGIEVKKLTLWHSEGVLDDIHGIAIPTEATFVVKAKKIILCAGSLGSPTILLKSGIGEFNANVGKGVILHPAMPIISLFDEEIHVMKGLTASVYNDHFALQKEHGFIWEAMSAGPGYGAMMVPGNGTEVYQTLTNYSKIGGFGVMLVDESSLDNRVVLDQDGNPQIDYHLTEEDKSRFRIGIRKGIQIMFAAGAKQVTIPSFEIREPGQAFFADEKEALAAVEQLQFIANRTTLTSAHMQGTNKMGTSLDNSVVDTDHRVWGIDNLYVVDGSIFPTSVGANPMQTIYTVAKIFADRMVR